MEASKAPSQIGYLSGKVERKARTPRFLCVSASLREK